MVDIRAEWVTLPASQTWRSRISDCALSCELKEAEGNLIRGFILVTGLAVACASSGPGFAQQNDPTYLESRFDHCHERARAFSRYDGPVPDRYRPGGTLEGAARGAARGAATSLITGDTSKSTGLGALFGGLFGSIKRSEARQEEDRRARVYRLELDACMRGRR